jgi:hypothetical protein
MRVIRLVAAALLLLGPASAFAQAPSVFAPGQEATDYISRLDYFSVNFPGEPKIQEITYPDEYRITLPGRTYTADAGRNHYKVTVVDYRDALKIHAARNAKCVEDAGANRPGLTAQQRRDLVGDACQDDGVKDVRGAMMYATWNFVQKASKVTHLATYNTDVIEGNEVHTINPDETRTYAVVHMYENRLYIVEATVPKNAPAANWFQISLRFLDEEYKPVRYQYSGLMVYSNGYPKPPRANQGQNGQGGQGAQDYGAQGQGQGRQGGRGRQGGAQGQGQPAR